MTSRGTWDSPGPLHLQGRKGLVGSEIQGIRKEKLEKSLATWAHCSHYDWTKLWDADLSLESAQRDTFPEVLAHLFVEWQSRPRMKGSSMSRPHCLFCLAL